MKTFARLLGFLPLLAAVTLTSCSSKEQEEKESVNVVGVDVNLHFAAIPAGALSFTIESNVAWSISKTDLDWLTIDPMRGSAKDGAQTVTLTARTNETEEALSGSFTVTAGSYSKKVNVTQDAAQVTPTFATNGLTGNAIAFAADETAAKTFQVSSNKDWKATLSGLDWADVTPLEGDKNRSATITVTPKAVNTGDARQGTISFNYGADAPYVVTISQEAFAANLTIDPTTLNADATGKLDKATVTVTANAAWTAKSSAAFVTLDKTSGAAGTTTVTVTVTANDKTEARSAVVTFENGAKAELTVNQAAKPTETLTVSATELTYEVEGSAQTVNVTSNAAWTVTTTESWVTVAPASGNGNGTVTVTADANTGTARTATVTIAVSDDLKAAIAVSQKGAAAPAGYIDLTTPLAWCSNNQSWNMEHNPDWASAGQTGNVSGIGSGHLISYTYPDNEKIYAQFTKGDNDQNYTTLFIMTADNPSKDPDAGDGNITWKPTWTDDELAFHIPVASLKKGDVLHFDYALYCAGTCSNYWNSEVSFDGGTTWISFDNSTDTETNVFTTPANNMTANSKIEAARKGAPYQGKVTVPEDITEKEIIARIRCVDGPSLVTGKTGTKPNSGGTVRVIGGEKMGYDFIGPTFYVK